MEIESNDEELTIKVQYKSHGEFKKLALQKRMRLAIKTLERGGLIQTTIDEDKYSISIKCYDLNCFLHILKGFKSVSGLT